MPCRYVDMSICRCDSMWWQPLFGISGAWLAFFSPQSSRRSAMDTERNAIWTPEFIVVHHSSSRIQELSPDIHVPCYGHTGHTHYVSFFTGPSWWRYWETLRILCMMLSTLKNRTVIGDHDPILLEKTHLFATTTYSCLLINLGDVQVLSYHYCHHFGWQEKTQLCPSSASRRLAHGCRNAFWNALKHGLLQHLICFGFPMKNPSHTSQHLQTVLKQDFNN